MNIENKTYQALFKQYADHTISREGYDQLLVFIAENGTDDVEEVLDQDWAQMSMDFPFSEIRQEGLYQKIHTAGVLQQATPPAKVGRLWQRIAIAAAIVCIMLSTIVILSRYAGEGRYQDPASEKYANDIPAPIGNKAMLTLPTGETINLNETKKGIIIDATKLTYNDGTGIQEPTRNGSRVGTQYSPLEGVGGEPQFVTLTTPRGGQYQVKLPDGTVVNMNAGSTLKFPSAFTNLKERNVVLEGEAYFDVIHNAKQPFKVTTKDQVVEDIGTQFNINAYPDEPAIRTTLIEGSAIVRLAINSSKVDTREITLKPGEQSEIINKKLTMKAVNPSEAISWTNGQFMFTSEPVPSIMRKISRWYNVDIIYTDNMENKKFTGTISRYVNVSEVLEALSLTNKIKFKIEGRKIIVEL